MSIQDKLKVAIDACVAPASAGGIAQVMLGLISALGKLDDEGEEYLLVVESKAEADYIEPYLGPNQKIAWKPSRSLAERVSGRLARLSKTAFGKKRRNPQPAVHAVSDGFYEKLGCEVIHFPHQRFVLCGLPSIYNPHDLQHLHFPQFFTAEELLARDTLFQTGLHFADTVAAASQWVKDDIIRSYQLPPDKVQVIPWGPPTQAYAEPSEADLARVRDKYNLHEPYGFYPAMTWPHKNHVRLLEALAWLRDHSGLRVPLICSGSRLQPYWSTVERRIRELKLDSQVRFIGFVADADLRSIYRLSQFLVVPTLFESDSSPIYEAWLEGLPVTCSNVTSLPAQTLGAARLFDPYEVGAIAEAVSAMATDDQLRKDLRSLGYVRVKDYDWQLTAKAYRALYRRAARRDLPAGDKRILERDWMLEPERTLEAWS